MQKKLVQEFYKALVEHLTEKRFLKTLKLTKKEMLYLVCSDKWKEEVGIAAETEKVSCADVLAMCRKALDAFSKEPEEGWLHYIYRYAIDQMFPGDSQSSQSAVFERGRLFYLEVLRCFLSFERQLTPFDSKSHFQFLDLNETSCTEAAAEYRLLLQTFQDQYLYEFMRIGSEITRHKTLAHISGVHYVSMFVGKQLLEADVPIDLALLSGAALGHDIGKYGCKPEEAKRIPYLHYYYTDQYFKRNHMPVIGHIASNHSTWDLELENLSVESLVLIYADFRVKSMKDGEGKEVVHFFSLTESFDVILGKLDNVDDAKRSRYRKVYSKLKDFENYMVDLGVCTELNEGPAAKPDKIDPALLHSGEVVRSLKNLAIRHNLSVMHILNSDADFGDILEAARTEKNWRNMRSYINIFQEYFTYMTQKQKIITLNFLYELLMHREGDIRRQSADLIGNIIVHFDEEYRKELPEGVKKEMEDRTSRDLWAEYLHMVVSPDHKVTDQHKRWLGYTLKFILGSVLERCKEEDRQSYVNPLLEYYCDHKRKGLDAFILLDSALALPLSICTENEKQMLLHFACRLVENESTEMQIAALRVIQYLTVDHEAGGAAYQAIIDDCLTRIDTSQTISMAYLEYKIRKNSGIFTADTEYYENNLPFHSDVLSDILLENLKAATPWVAKLVHIEFLLDQVKRSKNSRILQIAAHLSNLVKVSERVAVRHSAGNALLSIIPLLNLTERNEIAVELTKGLEIGEYEFSKYIPQYLGELALFLHPDELDELILDFGKMLNSNSDRICSVTMDTLGVILQKYSFYPERFDEKGRAYEQRREKMIGLILKGLSNYHDAVSQEAFLVIGQYLFGSSALSLQDKSNLFSVLYKKMLTLIADRKETELSFFNSAAALNHIYRFLSDYLFLYEKFNLKKMDKIGFLPGSFDPFSMGHKGILRELKKLGLEVYLAIDEFSWPKKTQPKMIRRQIISMSIADEKDVFLFPDDIPVNLGNPEDLNRLKELFPLREIYIVAGSDVIENISSYQAPSTENSVHSFHHIVIRRSEQPGVEMNCVDADRYPQITGRVIELTLPKELDEISSADIRENIDCNRDISNLIDPLVQNYIYDNSLYLREPQFKHVFGANRFKMEVFEASSKKPADEIVGVLFTDRPDKERIRAYLQKEGTYIVVVRDKEKNNQPVAVASFHETGMAELYEEFENLNLASYIRRITSGKLIVLTGLAGLGDASVKNPVQLVLTEALAYCLRKDFTYAIYHNRIGEIDTHIIEMLKRQGFAEINGADTDEAIFAVDMKFPVALFRDIETMVKEPFDRQQKVLDAIEKAHRKIQHAVTAMYPGCLVLSFDAGVINHRIADMISKLNEENQGQVNKGISRSEMMCVPFGKILHGLAIPNTVTKSLHAEKVFEPAINQFRIAEFPYHSPLINQVRTIKSFRQPVLLVDDVLHKGHRIRELDPIFKQENVEVVKIVVGVLSGRGRDLMALQGREAECVYFIPNLKTWFDESSLYPFLGGDGIRREQTANAGITPSINLILPYAAPGFLMDVPKDALYNFSMVCLENVREILTALEEEYQHIYERNLTLNRLSEAVNLPRYPDKGINISYDMNLAPSVYIENDIEHLRRLKNLIV